MTVHPQRSKNKAGSPVAEICDRWGINSLDEILLDHPSMLPSPWRLATVRFFVDFARKVDRKTAEKIIAKHINERIAGQKQSGARVIPLAFQSKDGLYITKTIEREAARGGPGRAEKVGSKVCCVLSI